MDRLDHRSSADRRNLRDGDGLHSAPPARPANLSKNSTHGTMSGTELSQLIFPLDREDRLDPLAMDLGQHPLDVADAGSPRPHHGPSGPNLLRSLKWKLMIRPSNFFRHSTGTRPERTQWPVSQQAPIRLLWFLQAASTMSGFQ